jgi:hypothetical protein
MFATALASLTLVVMVGGFVSGMAIGINSNETVQTLAGNTIFAPVVSSVAERDFSFSGRVIEVKPKANDEGAVLHIETASGERAINIDYRNLKKHSQAEGDVPLKGDDIFVIGVPGPNGLEATFVRTF